ncbi:lectin C-type domain protein, partial [Ostertagia ostertagi]
NSAEFLSSSRHAPIEFKPFGDSCIYFETEKLSYEQAEMRCNQKGATMFAPTSMAQWNEVMSKTPPYFWTWTGITQPTQMDEPQFQGGALNASLVNWLIKPYSSLSNGWSTFSTCAAYYNTQPSSANYVYFYPCTVLYHSICQMNPGEAAPQPFRRKHFKLHRQKLLRHKVLRHKLRRY